MSDRLEAKPYTNPDGGEDPPHDGKPTWVEGEQGGSRDRSDPAMTPPPQAPMVTDADAEAWRKFAEAVTAAAPAPKQHNVIPEPEQCVLRLLADRKRTLGLLWRVGLWPDPDRGGEPVCICVLKHTCLFCEVRKLLTEARRGS